MADDPQPRPAQDPPALDPGLGSLHHPVSTRNRLAQAYFDQGLRLTFAFNHAAAIESFQRAATLDPGLAMAHWGIALALGPNINEPMSPQAHQAAFVESRKALALVDKASAAERAYIDALSARYSDAADSDVMKLQVAYKDAMAGVVHRYPRDVDAAVLYAESLMDLHPWKLWTADGMPAEGTLEIVAVLERALAQQPSHIGANHYYIHAVEASPHPQLGLKAAQRLETLAPSAGHLVHMPAHVYIRSGNYLAAARANEIAARADERLIRAGAHSDYVVGYYGHNLHFLAISNAMAGNSQEALAAARKLYDYEAPRIKEVPLLDGFLMTPELLLVKFARWDEILSLPEPAFEAPMTGAFWHFARTLALAHRGRAAEAQAERAKFVEATASLPKSLDYGNNDVHGLTAVATPYLDGQLALVNGDLPRAIDRFRQAVSAEDALAYDEPPAWYLPSREALGFALLRSGDAAAAAQTFRLELDRNVESGRALYGLQKALSAQGDRRAATAVRQRFARAWRGADVPAALAEN